jgi:hypothetical protein
MTASIHDLERRLSHLDSAEVDSVRKPIYRYYHRGTDPMENSAWRFFVQQQLGSLEFEEIRSINKRRRYELTYASTTANSPRDSSEEDEALHRREVALLELAELRAEQLARREPTQWHSWLQYFQAHVWPEFNKPVDVEIHAGEEEDFLCDFFLRHVAAYKIQEAQS